MQDLLQEIWRVYQATIVFITHDIDEAILLADRVVVMSSRPGRIAEVIEVKLDRPREYDVLLSTEFNKLKGIAHTVLNFRHTSSHSVEM